MTAYVVWLDGREQISKNYLRGYRLCQTFEGMTGADILITPLKGQISSDTIQMHLDAGMVMIQVKHGMDLSASVIDQRLTEAILRMNTWEAQAYQCGLLITGKFENILGHLYINGQRSSLSWKGYNGALSAWGIRGGFVWPTITRSELQGFVDGLGNKLFVGDPFVRSGTPKQRKKFREAKVFKKGMTLREKARMATKGVDSSDLRHLLVNIDGLTNTTVAGIWKMMEDEKMPMNISTFVNLAIGHRLTEVKGIGPKIQEKVRSQLGYGKKSF